MEKRNRGLMKEDDEVDTERAKSDKRERGEGTNSPIYTCI